MAKLVRATWLGVRAFCRYMSQGLSWGELGEGLAELAGYGLLAILGLLALAVCEVAWDGHWKAVRAAEVAATKAAAASELHGQRVCGAQGYLYSSLTGFCYDPAIQPNGPVASR